MNSTPIPFVEGQSELWCLLCPFGEFPGVVTLPNGTKRDVMQICDNKAFAQVIANFNGEVLVDFEHRSEMPNMDSDTSASGWVQELRIGPDGLECRNKLTDLGADDLRNRRRRFLSPVWPIGEDGRPVLLRSVALTNTPNIHGQPVLNKESAATAGKSTGDQQVSPTERRVRMDSDTYNKLAAKLGLKDGHSPADFEGAISSVLNKAAQVDSLSARVADLEKAARDKQLGDEADACVAANKDRIVDPAGFRAAYIANKESVLSVLAVTKVAEKVASVCNKSDAKKPDLAKGGTVAANKLTEYRAMPSGKAKDAYLAANKAELMALETVERNETK